jgi:hypothetical protein
VLGTLKMTRRDLTGIQYVEVWRRPDLNRRKDLLDEWILQMTASSVRDGDIVCLLQGASRPTIIRPYSVSEHSYDRFIMVVIQSNSMSDSRPEYPLRDFLLVWDWGQDSRTKSHAQQALDRVCGKSTRLLHSTLILKDAGTHGWRAEQKLEAVLANMTSFRDAGLFQITQEELADIIRDLSQKVAIGMLEQKGDELVLTLEMQTNIARRFGARAVTLMQDSKLEEMKRNISCVPHRSLAQVSQAPSRGFPEIDSSQARRKWSGLNFPEEVLEAAAENFDHEVLEFLLRGSGQDMIITDAVVENAFRNHRRLVLAVVVRHRAIEVTETVVSAVTGTPIGSFEGATPGREKTLILLKREPVSILVTDALLAHMVGNLDKEVVVLFFDRAPNKIIVTPALLEAAATNCRYGKKVLEFLLDQEEPGTRIQISESVFTAASGGAVVDILVDRNRGDVEVIEAMIAGKLKSWMDPEEREIQVNEARKTLQRRKGGTTHQITEVALKLKGKCSTEDAEILDACILAALDRKDEMMAEKDRSDSSETSEPAEIGKYGSFARYLKHP